MQPPYLPVVQLLSQALPQSGSPLCDVLFDSTSPPQQMQQLSEDGQVQRDLCPRAWALYLCKRPGRHNRHGCRSRGVTKGGWDVVLMSEIEPGALSPRTVGSQKLCIL